MYQHESTSVCLGLAERWLEGADAIEVPSAVELQQRDQVFLALFSIFMKISKVNYQRKEKNLLFSTYNLFPMYFGNSLSLCHFLFSIWDVGVTCASFTEALNSGCV